MQAYVEFMATFDEQTAAKEKVWVKAGTFNAGSRSKSDLPVKLRIWTKICLICFKTDITQKLWLLS